MRQDCHSSVFCAALACLQVTPVSENSTQPRINAILTFEYEEGVTLNSYTRQKFFGVPWKPALTFECDNFGFDLSSCTNGAYESRVKDDYLQNIVYIAENIDLDLNFRVQVGWYVEHVNEIAALWCSMTPALTFECEHNPIEFWLEQLTGTALLIHKFYSY